MLQALRYPPGMVRVGTEYESIGRWREGNLVRWHEGVLRPVGGWAKKSPSQLTGIPRALHSWRQNNFQARLAVGTHTNLYVFTDGSMYDITPADLAAGKTDTIYGYGYGARSYSSSSYGTPRAAGVSLLATSWTLDNFGEWLVGCQDYDGRLFVWKNNVTVPAAVVTNAPTNCLGVMVTPERHLLAIGPGGDRRSVAWSSSEDTELWTPTATNSAGGLTLATSERITAWKRARELSLLWTENEIHALVYKEYPYIYGSQKIASGCGSPSPHAGVVLEGGVVWMSAEGFHLYDGAVSSIPCTVHDAIFRNVNRAQLTKVVAGQNRRYNEVWWFYPSASSSENDQYVIWNYRDDHWATGTLPRSAWHDAGVYENPLAMSSDGYLYEHEFGWTNDGTPIGADRWIRSGPNELGAGDQVMRLNGMIPDRDSSGATALKLRTRNYPEDSWSSSDLVTMTPKMDFRLTGRQIEVEIVGQRDEDWRVGILRADVLEGGRR
ncbi:MAG: hypothetical protein ABFE08_09040 [Armatimonadia bacterium]